MSESNESVFNQQILVLQQKSIAFEDISTSFTKYNIGPKAKGLLSIPFAWYPPFFLSDCYSLEHITADKIIDAFQRLSLVLTLDDYIIIRSNQNHESIVHRGAHDSYKTKLSELGLVLSNPEFQQALKTESFWIIQKYEDNKLSGHLSNERRLSLVHRDWIYETETVDGKHESGPIPLRKWRTNSKPNTGPLECKYAAAYTSSLRTVATWASNQRKRLHFEWVWNGTQLYVVQADVDEPKQGGVSPQALVKANYQPVTCENLKVFRLAQDEDFERFSKLKNAQIYKRVGYEVTKFYIWDNAAEIRNLIVNRQASPALINDLEILTKNVLVLRTDGVGLPAKYKTMLPRSDELRSAKAALDFLTNVFAEKINDVSLEQCDFCLIGHHFIPAISSAWCLADAASRSVRIESLWGIPEGLYWYAHDVFDVDTKKLLLSDDESPPPNPKISAKFRYKDKFIAPDENGVWVVHHTDSNSDWLSSISDWDSTNKSSEWVSEIAWNSRKISKLVGKPVVIMWFIGAPKAMTKHSVLPWFHSEWESVGSDFAAAPKYKNPDADAVIIRTFKDWEEIRKRGFKTAYVERVIVEPEEPELVRNQKFSDDLAKFAIKNNLIVELAGGVLSHAFYMLTKRGVKVECKDLFGIEEDKIEFNKLVRDKVPDNIIAGGESVDIVNVKGDALIKLLKSKIVEESLEVYDANNENDILEELVDLLEVGERLVRVLGISKKSILEVRDAKNQKRGAFDKGSVLLKTTRKKALTPLNQQNDDLFPHAPQSTNREITDANELFQNSASIHMDNREQGDSEIKQFTITLPVDERKLKPQTKVFTFSGGFQDFHNQLKKLDLQLEIEAQRSGSELKVKLNLVNAMRQLTLDLDDDE